MLFVRHACLFIIDDLVVAVESKSVLHVAANPKDGNGFVGRGKPPQPVSERARRGGAIEQSNHALGGSDRWSAEEGPKPIKEEDKNNQDSAGGKAQARNAKTVDHHK